MRRANVDSAMDLLDLTAIALAFIGMLLLAVAGPSLRLEELVDETLGFVGVFGGARTLGGNKRALSAEDVARFECDL